MGEREGTTRGRRNDIAALACVAPVAAAILAGTWHDEVRGAMTGALPLLGRHALLFATPLLALLLGNRFFGWRTPVPTIALGLNLFAFAAFAGLAQAAALVLLAAASLVAGSWLWADRPPPRGSIASSVLAGLGIIVGLVGWLLPLPIHSGAGYLGALLLTVGLGWRRLGTAIRLASDDWNGAVRAHPFLATTAIYVAGFASVFSWLPTMNPDDNALHLLMAGQLAADGYYRIDVSGQIFAAAPWFNDALHSVVALASAGDARQAVGLAWLVIGAAGAYRLASELGAAGTHRWLAVALYASYPLTAYFGMTLQVDGASAACLLHLAAYCAGMRESGTSAGSTCAAGAICGIAVALKVTNGVYIAGFGAWLAWHHIRQGQWRVLVLAIALGVAIAASSYSYAFAITGNPLFPLFNGVFRSPYMPPVDFADPRWHHGVAPSVLWDVTFDSGTFMEAYPGAAGLALVGLVGAWAFALARGGRLAVVAAIALVSGAVVFFQVQYLRYVFPAIAVLLVVGVVAIGEAGWRRAGIAGIVALVLAQCTLVRTTSWILAAGAAEQMLADGPSALDRIEAKFVPERALVAHAGLGADDCLLFADPVTAYVAIAPGRSLTTGFYDPRMQAMARWAVQDEEGTRWKAALDNIGVTHVELRPATAPPSLLRALPLAGFEPDARLGDAELWARSGPAPASCRQRVFLPRDQARRLVSDE